MSDVPLSGRLQQIFKQIKNDRERGARELTRALLNDLVDWSRAIPESKPICVQTFCRCITQLRPEMASLRNVGYFLWKRVPKDPSEHIRPGPLTHHLTELLDEFEEIEQRIRDHLSPAMDSDRRVMVFSRSGTVLYVIQHQKSIKQVTVLHSYPGEEGIKMAKQCDDLVDVQFLYDMEAGRALETMDALYLGADTLRQDGSIVNKTGSRLLARSSGTVPVRVITDVWKFAVNRYQPTGPCVKSPETLPSRLRHSHPLFETVSSRWIQTYVTDRGVYENPDELMNELSDLRGIQKSFPPP